MAYFKESERPVAVGVDGSDSAPRAAREADRRHAPLRLVHACHLTPVRHPRQVPAPRDYRAAVLAEGRQWLTKASAVAVRTVPGVPMTARHFPERERQRRVAGLGPVHPDHHRALCPRRPVAGGRARDHDRAVRVHGQRDRHRADEQRRAPAEPARAQHHQLRGPRLSPSRSCRAAASKRRPWLQDEEENRLVERLTTWHERFPHVEVRPVVTRDRPERALLTHGTGAQLVVVGAHVRCLFTGRGFRSVSHALPHHAECPVAVARTEAAASVAGQGMVQMRWDG